MRAASGGREAAIRNDDIRAMVRALRNNEIVWYAPDQCYRKKGAQMVPFFGVPAATNTFTFAPGADDRRDHSVPVARAAAG